MFKGIRKIIGLYFSCIFWKEIQLTVPIKSVIRSEISIIRSRKTKITAKKVISGCKKRLICVNQFFHCILEMSCFSVSVCNLFCQKLISDRNI